MKKLQLEEMELVNGGRGPIQTALGCAAYGTAAIIASASLLLGSLLIGTLTYAGCLLLES